MNLTIEQIEKITKANNTRAINRYEYLGMLSDYQTVSKNLTQTIVYTELNATQAFLFKRVLHGLNAYNHDEVKDMHWDKKRRIKKVWRRAQDVINRMKQRITNQRANEVLEASVWRDTPIIKALMNVPVEETDDKFINRMPLKTLGIKYEDLIIKFYAEGLLPKNYFQLV